MRSWLLRVCWGVVWRRGAETLSGIVLLTEWLSVGGEWLGKNLSFATPEEIAACPAIRDNLQAGDRALHHQNTDPEGIAEDGRAGQGWCATGGVRCG